MSPTPLRFRSLGAERDDVEVDIHGLRHRPTEIADLAARPDPRAVTEGRVHGHGGGHLEDGQPQRPGEELGDVDGLTATEPDDAPGGRQPLRLGPQVVEVEAAHEVDPGEAIVEVVLEPRP